jgi:hypothetical protein
VLPDGRVIIEGGEYNNLTPVWTNLGAIYDPVADTWTSVAPPAGWNNIGDAPASVLANGTYMQSSCCTKQAALLDPATLTWTSTGAGKFDVYDEEGWTLLPNGQLLTVDAYVFQYDAGGTNSELYTPATGTWASAGSTAVQLWDAHCGDASRASYEVGPAVLPPDKTVFAMGSNGCGAAHNAIFDTRTGTWTAAPDFPQNLGVADGPVSDQLPARPSGEPLHRARVLLPHARPQRDGRRHRQQARDHPVRRAGGGGNGRQRPGRRGERNPLRAGEGDGAVGRMHQEARTARARGGVPRKSDGRGLTLFRYLLAGMGL